MDAKIKRKKGRFYFSGVGLQRIELPFLSLFLCDLILGSFVVVVCCSVVVVLVVSFISCPTYFKNDILIIIIIKCV